MKPLTHRHPHTKQTTPTKTILLTLNPSRLTTNAPKNVLPPRQRTLKTKPDPDDHVGATRHGAYLKREIQPTTQNHGTPTPKHTKA